jgi:hypothetical protein
MVFENWASGVAKCTNIILATCRQDHGALVVVRPATENMYCLYQNWTQPSVQFQKVYMFVYTHHVKLVIPKMRIRLNKVYRLVC